MRKTRVVSWLVLFCLIPGSLFALDFDKVHVNGFLSQGYMETRQNAFLDPDSEDGTFNINEFGLAINAPVTDKLRFGLQLLSRDLGDEGNNDIELDWAFGDYRFTDWFGVRAGKIKMPIGLYNESRDSDFLRSMAFLPQSIYDESRRSFLVAGVGGGIYGNVPVGAAGDVDYKFFYGQIDVPEDTYIIEEGVEAPLNDFFMDNFGVPISALDYDSDCTTAVALIYNPPVAGLRLGLSYFKTEGEWEAKSSVMNLTVDANIKSMYVFSLEYNLPEFSFRAEYMQRDNDVKVPALGPYGDKEVSTSEGGYMMVTYPVPLPFLKGLSLSAMYDVFYLDKNHHNGSTANGPKEIGWRRDLAFGFRYDFNENWLVKAEWHTVDGCAANMDLYNDNPLEEDWSYYIIKTSFNF